MPNNKNNKKGIELLPEELRRKEEKKKEEKKPEITFYVPSEEEKSKIVKISLFEKIFGTKEERGKKKLAHQKEKEEKEKKKAEEKAKLEALKVQKEAALRAEKEKKEKEKIEAKIVQKPGAAVPKIEEEKKRVIKMWEPKIKKEMPSKPLRPFFGITLMPEEAVPTELPSRKQWVIVLVFALLACLISLVLYLIMFFYQLNIKDRTKIVLQNIESLKKEAAPYEKDKTEAQKIQGQLEAIKNLLTSHLYWTKFFDLLEKNTVPDVYYTNFVAGADGEIALSAVGKSFSSVAEQLTAFREAKDFIKEVSITGASAQVDPTGQVTEVNFEVDLKLIPGVFLK